MGCFYSVGALKYEYQPLFTNNRACLNCPVEVASLYVVMQVYLVKVFNADMSNLNNTTSQLPIIKRARAGAFSLHKLKRLLLSSIQKRYTVKKLFYDLCIRIQAYGYKFDKLIEKSSLNPGNENVFPFWLIDLNL